jgi:hypothetical protein
LAILSRCRGFIVGDGPKTGSGGCLWANLGNDGHTFEINSEVGPDGAYVLRHHMLVHLRFHFVDLKDFKHQNDLYGIHFKDI